MLTAFLYLNFLGCRVFRPCSGTGSPPCTQIYQTKRYFELLSSMFYHPFSRRFSFITEGPYPEVVEASSGRSCSHFHRTSFGCSHGGDGGLRSCSCGPALHVRRLRLLLLLARGRLPSFGSRREFPPTL
jgi:hypothetical protein